MTTTDLVKTPGVVRHGEVSIKINPAGNLGAEIVGFDFDALATDQVEAVRAAWLKHGVIRFRGYQISDEQQVAFTSQFGEFVKHPVQMKGEEGAHSQYEEILIIGNAKRDGKMVGTYPGHSLTQMDMARPNSSGGRIWVWKSMIIALRFLA